MSNELKSTPAIGQFLFSFGMALLVVFAASAIGSLGAALIGIVSGFDFQASWRAAMFACLGFVALMFGAATLIVLIEFFIRGLRSQLIK